MVTNAQPVEAIYKASRSVKGSASLTRVLEVVLMLGNYMNADGAKGGAQGFKISSINKLTDTKSADNQVTLLHYIVATVQAKMPEVLGLREELHDCEAPCKRT